MRKWMPLLFLLFLSVGLPALGFYLGHRWTYLRMRKKPWEVSDQVRQRVEHWQRVETLAGAFALLDIPIDGVERCYYDPHIDLGKVSWSCPTMPTPFVNYMPIPGPIASGRINSNQFRYDRELVVPKPKGVCRIFLVGGSTALGTGASGSETTIAGYLERYLNAESQAFGCEFEVVTAAASAWASTHERILIENRLVEFQPDLVIALSGHNDAHWSSWDRNTMWFRSYNDDYHFLLANSLLTCNFEMAYPSEVPGTGQSVSLEQTCDRLRRNVLLAHEALRGVQADYCFALQPILATSKKPRTPREDQMAAKLEQESYRTRYDAFKQCLGSLDHDGFRFIDLTGIFDDMDAATDVFIDGCHFGDRGHDRIARTLQATIRGILEKRSSRVPLAAQRKAKPVPATSP